MHVHACARSDNQNCRVHLTIPLPHGVHYQCVDQFELALPLPMCTEEELFFNVLTMTLQWVAISSSSTTNTQGVLVVEGVLLVPTATHRSSVLEDCGPGARGYNPKYGT